MRLQILAPAGFLVGAGLVVLSGISFELFTLQLLWVALGASVVALFCFIDWRSLFNYSWFLWVLYGIAILFLILVYLKGPVIRNIRGWLVFGPFRFQPVEFAKLALVFFYARYFSRRHMRVAHWSTIVTSFFYCALPVILVMLQPDLGSAFVLISIWLGFLLVSGLPRRRIFVMLGLFAVFAMLAWNFGLKEYQRDRIVGVFYPDRDLLGINYSQEQAKIAIGSAGFLGKGYAQGSQTQLGFLTEPATDFIFAALIEEWGWLAGIAVVIVFCAFILMILRASAIADTNFAKFICLGVAIVFCVQFFVNAGSATGIFPVVGVTFPFLSYGGSSLFINFLLLAVVHAIARRS